MLPRKAETHCKSYLLTHVGTVSFKTTDEIRERGWAVRMRGRLEVGLTARLGCLFIKTAVASSMAGDAISPGVEQGVFLKMAGTLVQPVPPGPTANATRLAVFS